MRARGPTFYISLTPHSLACLPALHPTRCREERYLKDPDPFDWYQRYNNNPHLRGLLEKAVPRTAAILVPGSGTSRLSEDMLADGYTGGITNIDISRTAIDLMAGRCKDRAGLQCAWRPGETRGRRKRARAHTHAQHAHTLSLLPFLPCACSARSPGDEQLLPGLPRRLL